MKLDVDGWHTPVTLRRLLQTAAVRRGNGYTSAVHGVVVHHGRVFVGVHVTSSVPPRGVP